MCFATSSCFMDMSRTCTHEPDLCCIVGPCFNTSTSLVVMDWLVFSSGVCARRISKPSIQFARKLSTVPHTPFKCILIVFFCPLLRSKDWNKLGSCTHDFKIYPHCFLLSPATIKGLKKVVVRFFFLFFLCVFEQYSMQANIRLLKCVWIPQAQMPVMACHSPGFRMTMNKVVQTLPPS